MELEALKTIAVVGMGTMGRGIAQSLAAGGYAVRCHDTSAAALERSRPLIESMQQTLISAYLFADLNDAKGPPPCLMDLVATGRLGVKSGSGFYEYGGRTLAEALAGRDEALLRLLQALGQSKKESP